MLDWLIVVLVMAPLVATLVYLERTHAPRWRIWAVWIVSGAALFGIAGASLYHFQVVSILVFLLLGVFWGAAGALAMMWPLKAKAPAPRSRRR